MQTKDEILEQIRASLAELFELDPAQDHARGTAQRGPGNRQHRRRGPDGSAAAPDGQEDLGGGFPLGAHGRRPRGRRLQARAGVSASPRVSGRRRSECPGLRSHEWVADARLSGRWMLVVPSATRRPASCAVLARRHLVAEWQRGIGTGPRMRRPPCEWRLLETLPPAGSEAEARCMRSRPQPARSASLRRRGARGLRCRVRVPYDLAVFDGHFPTIPIVPGVVQVGWAVDLARTALAGERTLHGHHGAKFRRLVQPGMHLALTLERRPESGAAALRVPARGRAGLDRSRAVSGRR